MYPPSKLLDKVEEQVKAEFGDQITRFEWFHEEEYTTIMVDIRSTVMQIPVIDRTRQIINAIVGEPYIVSLLVTPIESVGCTDGLFNLTYEGGGNTFFIDYHAPERARSTPFSIPIHNTKIFSAVRTIHFDSAPDLWGRLFRFIHQAYAKKEGVISFREDVLAEPLRDFLIEHLDFIKHIAEAVREPLHIFEPAPPPIKPHSSTTNGMQQQQKRVPEGVQAALNKLDPNSPVYAAFSLIQTEEQRQELLALLTQNSQTASVPEPVAAA